MKKKSREEVRKNMQAVRSKNTKIELIVGKALWKKGYRYRKNNKTVFGKPDFTFKKLKIAIFCDSNFWHGKDWDILKYRLNTNREFWIKKIEGNIKRDIEVNQYLELNGWTVLRFWESEIKKHLDYCMAIIELEIKTSSLISKRVSTKNQRMLYSEKQAPKIRMLLPG